MHMDIYLPADIYGRLGSKATIRRLERAGQFPQRRYFDVDSRNPTRPYWLKSEIDAWMLDREQKAEEARAKAGLTGARLVLARQTA